MSKAWKKRANTGGGEHSCDFSIEEERRSNVFGFEGDGVLRLRRDGVVMFLLLRRERMAMFLRTTRHDVSDELLPSSSSAVPALSSSDRRLWISTGTSHT